MALGAAPDPSAMGALHALFFLCSPVLLDTRAPLPPHLPEGTIKVSRTSPVALGML